MTQKFGFSFSIMQVACNLQASRSRGRGLGQAWLRGEGWAPGRLAEVHRALVLSSPAARPRSGAI